MKTTKYMFDILMALCLITVFFLSECFAAKENRFHSKRNGYSIIIPDGWIQIPEQELSILYTHFSEEGKRITTYEAGFQRASAEQWLQYPYVVIQALPYSTYGSNRQLYEDELIQVIQTISGANIDNIIDNTMTPEAKEAFSAFTANRVYYDKENKSFSVNIETDIIGIGKVQGKAVGYFGKEALINMTFTAREPDWNQYESDRHLLFSSFEFSPEKAYKKHERNTRPSGNLGRSVLNFGIAFSLPCITIIILHLRNYFKTKHQREANRG